MSELRAFPAPAPTERYLTRAELAGLMSVSVSTVDRMVAAGEPSETWGRRSRRFLASRAFAWARAGEHSGVSLSKLPSGRWRAQVHDPATGRNGTIPALRLMLNDAMSTRGGRLIDRNPLGNLGVSRGPGRRHELPPVESTVRALIAAARRLSGPSFAAWLQVAVYTGTRPGELDALRWDRVDWDAGSILVSEQWSHTARQFTLPKNGLTREAILTPAAREALLGAAQESEFCFPSLRGGHWTASARAYHWKAIRADVGYSRTLYLATRHFAGWYMVNVLRLASKDVAIALGHTDGGQLVRTLYGHLDEAAARDRVRAAYEARSNVVPLRRVEGGESA